MNNWITIVIWGVVIAVVFGLLWWKGQVRQLALYCQETMVELKKCSWPTWDELKGSTVLITITIILLGAFISLMDLIFNKIFTKVF